MGRLDRVCSFPSSWQGCLLHRDPFFLVFFLSYFLPRCRYRVILALLSGSSVDPSGGSRSEVGILFRHVPPNSPLRSPRPFALRLYPIVQGDLS